MYRKLQGQIPLMEDFHIKPPFLFNICGKGQNYDRGSFFRTPVITIYPRSAIKIIIQMKLFPPHPLLQQSPPPNNPLPKMPFPSPPHAHERIRNHKRAPQLPFPHESPFPEPHPHPVAAKSLMRNPPIFSLHYTDIQNNLFCLLKYFIMYLIY